jgi:hypothetical protein
MIFNDQLRRVAGVGDLYTIGFDGVNVLGMDAFFDAQQDKEEQNLFHKWFIYLIYLLLFYQSLQFSHLLF